MSAKRKIIIGVAAATIGLGAPAATAATGYGTGHTGDHDVSNGVINVSDNNVGPIQVCNNEVPVNAVGGQVPVNDIAGVLGIGSHGNTAVVDNSCHQDDYKAD